MCNLPNNIAPRLRQGIKLCISSMQWNPSRFIVLEIDQHLLVECLAGPVALLDCGHFRLRKNGFSTTLKNCYYIIDQKNYNYLKCHFSTLC